jgi:site-specific recombinase XerD
VNPEADKARAGFLNYLLRERRLSAHTGLAYKRDLAAQAGWCTQQQLNDWQ